MSRRALVIGAHSADFVWRTGGSVALTTARGGDARVIALSYGERGESGELWKEQGQTVERVKRIRHDEAERAAAVLSADFRCLARRASGRSEVRYAEAFQRVVPQVVDDAAQLRAEKERRKREALEGGALSYDLDGLRALVEER